MAFLDFSSEVPGARVPEISQLMWVHFEEPEPGTEILEARVNETTEQIRTTSGVEYIDDGLPEARVITCVICDLARRFAFTVGLTRSLRGAGRSLVISSGPTSHRSR